MLSRNCNVLGANSLVGLLALGKIEDLGYDYNVLFRDGNVTRLFSSFMYKA